MMCIVGSCNVCRGHGCAPKTDKTLQANYVYLLIGAPKQAREQPGKGQECKGH